MNAHASFSLQKALLLFFALALFAMLAVLIKERLTHPSLTIELHPQEQMFRVSGQTVSKDMDEIAMLMQQVSASPNDNALRLSLVETLMRAGRWASAETFARKARAQEPKTFQPAYLLAIILHQQNNYTEAASMLEEALAVKDDASAHYSLAVLYLYFLSEPEKGKAQLEAGLKSPDCTEELAKNIREELKKIGVEPTTSSKTNPS